MKNGSLRGCILNPSPKGVDPFRSCSSHCRSKLEPNGSFANLLEYRSEKMYFAAKQTMVLSRKEMLMYLCAGVYVLQCVCVCMRVLGLVACVSRCLRVGSFFPRNSHIMLLSVSSISLDISRVSAPR